MIDQNEEFDEYGFNPETLSINKITTKDVNLYPTPTYDFINLELNRDIIVKNIQIYDINGQLVKTIITDQSRLMTIDVNNFVIGSYIIKLQTAEQIIVKKFIKI